MAKSTFLSSTHQNSQTPSTYLSNGSSHGGEGVYTNGTSTKTKDPYSDDPFLAEYTPNISLIQLGEPMYSTKGPNGIGQKWDNSTDKETKRADKADSEVQQIKTTRKKQLQKSVIDEYVQRNKHKVSFSFGQILTSLYFSHCFVLNTVDVFGCVV
ncbi:unnamed protein product [Anisakis simplex]|uniref:BZIP domain-containing protein n=1 Tax=Anisakis simplex TaxID=6269 RepID=A0A0M3J5N5_ANISI|nr:unnamed protein product [Anisakis simplex]